MNAMERKGERDAHLMMEALWEKIRAKKKGDIFDYLKAYNAHILQIVFVSVEAEAGRDTAVSIIREFFERQTYELGAAGIDVACMVKE